MRLHSKSVFESFMIHLLSRKLTNQKAEIQLLCLKSKCSGEWKTSVEILAEPVCF